MRELAESIWVHDEMVLRDEHKLPLRLTVVRLADGKLWVHTPTPLSEELKGAISELGEVGYLFCGNNLHNMWLLDWAKAYPGAEVWVTPGIPAKLPALQNFKLYSGDLWTEDFLNASMKEVSLFDETVFFHRSSRSLIVTDLVHNHKRHGIFIAPPLNRPDIIANPEAFKDFIAQVSAWDFTRIIIAHGDIIEQSAREEFQRISEPFT